ncbi:Aste57867_4655 [Aphanomyces stellatus]|uniref:Aste57867_4655 protein n=1 Tax=Aphanomyces stellatus TaxID=120398 RepID=A0A485KBQ5_9STRA|nr:hypothetical protein As57867_004642 [Aphanomyces stellatus]VFT81758.1 Aste57867_4655 [Aphanomyces stellatus]
MHLTKLFAALAVAAIAVSAKDSKKVRYTKHTEEGSSSKKQPREEVALAVDGRVQETSLAAAETSGALIALQDSSVDDDSNAVADSSGISMRCRFCGAHLAWKHHYQHLPNDNKVHAKNTRTETSLGDDGEVIFFDNPSGIEFELVPFVDSEAVASDAYTLQDTFFDSYNWRSLTCPRCTKHVGWKFTHVLQEQCMLDTERNMNSAAPTKKGSRAKLAAIVDAAFATQKCHVMSNGWWSYQHCYKNEIRQFHEEHDGTRPNDWSMGHFSEDRSNDKEISHHFSGGQHCDENGKLRSTTVKYVCCPEQADIVVDTIEEPSLCSYTMRVCVPDLCQSKPKNPDAAVAKKLEKVCAQTVAEHDTSVLPLFYTLVWPDTIAEDSPELKWAQSLSTVTSIIGR